MSNLRQCFTKAMARAKNEIDDFPWENKQAYALWLNQTYYFVQRSTRIIALAGSRFSLEQNEFHDRFIGHAREEKGHEKLLLNDLKQLDINQKELKVFSSTKAFFQMQIYWIEHVSPMSFFGYILMLEGLAISHAPTVIERLNKSFGPKPLSFLKVHAEEDEDHLEKALGLVNIISKEEESRVIENLEMCADLYFQFMRDIKLEISANYGVNQKRTA